MLRHGLEQFTQRFYVCNGGHEDDFTELSTPTERSHGIAEAQKIHKQRPILQEQLGTAIKPAAEA